jgi:hypothetical protein
VSILPSFAEFLKPFAAVMTVPTCTTFQTLVVGWLFAPRRTVTGMIVAAGAVGTRHHSVFHNVFAAAVWCRDRVGLLLLDLVLALLPQGVVFLALDDTLARKGGHKTFGAGMHHDALRSTRSRKAVSRGHDWVVLAVVLPCPLGTGRYYALPVLFRLYLNHKSAHKHRRVPRTRPQLAVELLQKVCRHRRDRVFHALGDSAYGGESVLAKLPPNCHLTSRLCQMARLHAPAPVGRRPGQKGRTPKRGERLDTPAQMLDRRGRRVTLAVYGRRDRVRRVEQAACACKVPGRLLRVAAVEALRGGRGREAFFSTDHPARAEDVLAWYAMRWGVEVAFHDAKPSLGFEDPPGWSKKAVERTAPTAMLLYTAVVPWFVQTGHRHYAPPRRPWYRKKVHPAFADMLATLKRETLRAEVSAQPDPGHPSGNPGQLEQLLFQLVI